MLSTDNIEQESVRGMARCCEVVVVVSCEVSGRRGCWRMGFFLRLGGGGVVKFQAELEYVRDTKSDSKNQFFRRSSFGYSNKIPHSLFFHIRNQQLVVSA